MDILRFVLSDDTELYFSILEGNYNVTDVKERMSQYFSKILDEIDDRYIQSFVEERFKEQMKHVLISYKAAYKIQGPVDFESFIETVPEEYRKPLCNPMGQKILFLFGVTNLQLKPNKMF